MTTGILEQIFEQNHKIIAILSDIQGKGVAAVKPVLKASEALNDIDAEMEKALTPSVPTAEGDIELDSEGQAWVEGVHASTKTKTTKGVWKKSKAKNKTQAIAPPQTQATAPPQTQATAPPQTQATNTDKEAAMAAMAVINGDHDVSYDLILKELFDTMGAKTFDELTPGQYPKANVIFSGWLEKLNTASSEIERLIEAAGQAGTDSVKIFFTNAGTTGLDESNNEALVKFLAEITPHREQWETYAASQAV